MIDPEAKVYLCWSETLDTDWKQQMKYLGIRVYSGPDVLDQDRWSTAYGIYRLEEDGSLVNLAAPVINWATYYEHLTEMILNGKWSNEKTAVNYWWGMASGVIDIHVSASLPYMTRKMISLLKNAMTAGTLNPFSGELRSGESVIQPEYSEKLPDETIMTMDWLNDNIIGTLPAYEMLNETARQVTDITGVEKVKAVV